jgi:hypothetical protein
MERRYVMMIMLYPNYGIHKAGYTQIFNIISDHKQSALSAFYFNRTILFENMKKHFDFSK